MNKSLLMNFSVDKTNKKINVEREFVAPLDKVWAAWTQSEILDKWWAPKPWKSETKKQDFREGGHWLYAMVGPNGEKHWARADYKTIKPQKSYSLRDAFCDENGNISAGLPGADWVASFSDKNDSTIRVYTD